MPSHPVKKRLPRLHWYVQSGLQHTYLFWGHIFQLTCHLVQRLISFHLVKRWLSRLLCPVRAARQNGLKNRRVISNTFFSVISCFRMITVWFSTITNWVWTCVSFIWMALACLLTVLCFAWIMIACSWMVIACSWMVIACFSSFLSCCHPNTPRL